MNQKHIDKILLISTNNNENVFRENFDNRMVNSNMTINILISNTSEVRLMITKIY